MELKFHTKIYWFLNADVVSAEMKWWLANVVPVECSTLRPRKGKNSSFCSLELV